MSCDGSKPFPYRLPLESEDFPGEGWSLLGEIGLGICAASSSSANCDLAMFIWLSRFGDRSAASGLCSTFTCAGSYSDPLSRNMLALFFTRDTRLRSSRDGRRAGR